MIFEFEEYAIDVYQEKMKTLADKKHRCECPPCRVFREHVHAFSDDVKQRFHELGLDLENPDEAYDLGKDEKGNTMYVGWWNICGKIIKNSEKPCRISDGFEVTFCDDALYTQKWFQNSPCIQMRAVIRGSDLKRLGKEYWRDTDAFGVSRNTFRYHMGEEVCSELKDLVGCELIGLDTGSVPMDGGRTKCHKVNIYVKHSDESDLRVVSLTADRDIDTCFDGIDRMVFTANISKAEMELAVEKRVPCPRGKIQKIKIFESTIAGERDRVIYDSHLLIEPENGKKMIFRIEPDGEEVSTVFAEVEDCNMEQYLRVSDVWFVHPTLIFDDSNEIVGLKSFYQTETKVRITTQNETGKKANRDDRVIRAHKCCFRNKNEIQKSKSCGCFHCLAIFSPKEIFDWIIERNFTDIALTRDDLSTARCPYCGTDSVIGDSSGFPITKEFLCEMEKHWFAV